jgi:hypothetical protein
MSEKEVESVSWINVVPLNRREKLARWWQEEVRQGSSYASERQRKAEFQTVIPVHSIERLACDSLREALNKQRLDIETGSAIVTFPRATPNGSKYFGSIGISSEPLNIRFSENGIVPLDNENH